MEHEAENGYLTDANRGAWTCFKHLKMTVISYKNEKRQEWKRKKLATPCIAFTCDYASDGRILCENHFWITYFSHCIQ